MTRQQHDTCHFSYLEESSTDERAEALEHDVEEGLQDSDLPAEDESKGDGRDDVAAGDVPDGLGDGGDSHAEREGNSDDVSGISSHARSASDEDEEHGTQELGGQAFEDVDDLAAELIHSDVGKKRNDCAHSDDVWLASDNLK